MSKKIWKKIALGMAGAIFMAGASACKDKDDEKDKVISDNSSIESVEDIELNDKVDDLIEEINGLKNWQQQVLNKLTALEGKIDDLDYDEIVEDLQNLTTTIENNKTISAEEKAEVLSVIEDIKSIANNNSLDMSAVKEAIAGLESKVDGMSNNNGASQEKLEELTTQLVDNVKIPLQYDKNANMIELFKEVDRIELKLPSCKLEEEDLATISADLLDMKKALTYEIGEDAISKLAESNYVASNHNIDYFSTTWGSEKYSAESYYDLAGKTQIASKDDGSDYAIATPEEYRVTLNGVYEEEKIDGVNTTYESFDESFLYSLKQDLNDDRITSISYSLDKGFTIEKVGIDYYTHVVTYEETTSFNVDENGALNYYLNDVTYYDTNGRDVESSNKTEATFKPTTKEVFEELKAEYTKILDNAKAKLENESTM